MQRSQRQVRGKREGRIERERGREKQRIVREEATSISVRYLTKLFYKFCKSVSPSYSGEVVILEKALFN